LEDPIKKEEKGGEKMLGSVWAMWRKKRRF